MAKTGVIPGPIKVNDDGLIVVESIPSLNVAMIFRLVATGVAVSEGFVKVMEGAVVSVPAPVVKVHA